MKLFKKPTVGDTISYNGTTTSIGVDSLVKKISGVNSFCYSDGTNIPSMETADMIAELKEMIDFIIENGYTIKTEDFRKISFGLSAGTSATRAEVLEHWLSNIIIFKTDDIEYTYKYIKERYCELKELLAIKDGSLFSNEVNDLFNYVKLKQNETKF